MKNPGRKYHSTDTIRQLIRDNNNLLMVLSRFNISFGFGDDTVGEVCQRHSVDTDTFLAVCNLLSTGVADFQSVDLQTLIDYLRRAHTSFIDISLPRIRQHLIEAINYDTAQQVSYLLMKFFDDYVREVKTHIEHEDGVIFRYAEALINGRETTKFDVGVSTANHTNMASRLRELKDLFIYHYKQAENMRMSLTLFDIITCEEDLFAHIEVEDRLFTPALRQLERSLERNRDTSSPQEEGNRTSRLELIGDREKEIIKWVARGKTNKEIADELCISVHTVTTHRRNISAKLDIHSPAGLTIFAILHNLISIEEVRPS